MASFLVMGDGDCLSVKQNGVIITLDSLQVYTLIILLFALMYLFHFFHYM